MQLQYPIFNVQGAIFNIQSSLNRGAKESIQFERVASVTEAIIALPLPEAS